MLRGIASYISVFRNAEKWFLVSLGGFVELRSVAHWMKESVASEGS
jgi:hypothetical protein